MSANAVYSNVIGGRMGKNMSGIDCPPIVSETWDWVSDGN